MTSNNINDDSVICPVQKLLKFLSGKLKPEIFRLSIKSSLRFNHLLRQIEGSNKQSLAVALKELEELEILERVVINKKPLHIEYHLTEKGKSLVPVFEQLEGVMMNKNF
ncbi:winged helix-turn-helix transcriptional regulator [Chryseobacterium oryctis]|uniref:Winged helix-turn-helix transcriptional regulator n=1 Tax=Chryseobacterium oryctis TaxID=2952618 RepID=A0ABT3HKV6_9FLAO|nr:winged helix-turn-helix transcriptional regulator [Chryseobacterium oryctis]MCW3160417.1 winged helix-turn-helix transcriptional regulator [Chryseobacterium oryctis]